MLHQHAGGDGAHAPGDRGDGIHDGRNFFKAGVAGNAAFCAVPVDGNIDDRLPRADKIGGQTAKHTGGGHDNVGIAADGGDIFSLGVADRDSSVFMLNIIILIKYG